MLKSAPDHAFVRFLVAAGLGVAVVLGAVLAGAGPAGGQTEARGGCGVDPCFEEVVARIKRSVVGIGTFEPLRQPQARLMGTGFAIADGTLILTNYHVVEDHLVPAAKEYLVAVIGRGQRVNVRAVAVVETDEVYDLALLRLDEGDPVPALDLDGGSQMAGEGRRIAITGFPLGPVYGMYPVTHAGIVAAITPNKAPLGNARHLSSEIIRRARFDVYQLDLTAYPGNSGSPLYDARSGTVLGILNSAFVKDTRESAITNPSGISFAIPTKYIKLLTQKVKELRAGDD